MKYNATEANEMFTTQIGMLGIMLYDFIYVLLLTQIILLQRYVLLLLPIYRGEI